MPHNIFRILKIFYKTVQKCRIFLIPFQVLSNCLLISTMIIGASARISTPEHNMSNNNIQAITKRTKKQNNNNKLGLSCGKLRASLNFAGLNQILVYFNWLTLSVKILHLKNFRSKICFLSKKIFDLKINRSKRILRAKKFWF